MKKPNKVIDFIKKEKITLIILVIISLINYQASKINVRGNSEKNYQINFIFSQMNDEAIRQSNIEKSKNYCDKLIKSSLKVEHQCNVYEIDKQEIQNYLKVLVYSDYIFVFDEVNQTNIQLINVGQNAYLYNIEINYNPSWKTFDDFQKILDAKIKIY